VFVLSEVSATDRSLAEGILPSVVCLNVIEEPYRGGVGLLRGSSHEKQYLVWSWYVTGPYKHSASAASSREHASPTNNTINSQKLALMK